MPPSDPALAELEAIDAALAGAPVDPEHAEVAELSLLLAALTPRIGPEAERRLDARVGAAWEPAGPRPAAGRRDPHRRRRGSLRRAGAGVAVAAAVAVAVVIALPGHARPGLNGPNSVFSSAGAGSAAGTTPLAGSPGGSSSAAYGPPARRTPSAALGSQGTASAAGSESLSAVPPEPQGNGRRTVQTAQLTLSAAPSRIDTVAQELFTVVGAEAGIVERSQVSTGVGGLATFTLSIPTANLAATLTRLAELRYAAVVASTETSRDVNAQYLNETSGLTSEQRFARELRREIATAPDPTTAAELTTKLTAVETKVRSDETAISRLHTRIAYTPLQVQIDPGAVGGEGSRHPAAGGFTLRRAAHDALRVLVVAGGIALIALAGLIPVGLVAGLLLWGVGAVRRLRRERVLDAA